MYFSRQSIDQTINLELPDPKKPWLLGNVCPAPAHVHIHVHFCVLVLLLCQLNQMILHVLQT